MLEDDRFAAGPDDDAESRARRAPLSERCEELRRLVLEGRYDTLEALTALARALPGRVDLR